jgi:hypothetical protein
MVFLVALREVADGRRLSAVFSFFRGVFAAVDPAA